jgi:hypothetical protein
MQALDGELIRRAIRIPQEGDMIIFTRTALIAPDKASEILMPIAGNPRNSTTFLPGPISDEFWRTV